MHSGCTRFLRKPTDGFLYIVWGCHHEVGELVDNYYDLRKLFGVTVVFHSLPLTEGDTLTLECYSNEDCILWLTPVAEIYG